jgi:hypothetical protein
MVTYSGLIDNVGLTRVENGHPTEPVAMVAAPGGQGFCQKNVAF